MFVWAVMPDKYAATSHGCPHRFKTVDIEAGIEHGVLDAIRRHHPRNGADGYGEVNIGVQAADR